MLSGDGSAVKAGAQLATWDPLTRPIITEYEGTVKFEGVEEGVTVAKQIDEVTGLSTLVVIDAKRRSTAAKALRPQVKLINDQGEEVKIPGTDHSVTIGFPVGALIMVKDGQRIGRAEVLARIPTESQKTRDITGGLPRVAELFEARRPKESAVIAEISGTVRFGKDYKNKRRITIEPSGKNDEPKEYLVPKGKHIHLQDGDVVEKGDYIVDGNPAPHDILAIKGVEELAAYLVNEIQEVYRLQGVNINDKHIEVIARQMMRWVKIEDVGDTEFLVDEQVDKFRFLEENERVLAKSERPAQGRPLLLGITKASVQSSSFISAALSSAMRRSFRMCFT